MPGDLCRQHIVASLGTTNSNSVLDLPTTLSTIVMGKDSIHDRYKEDHESGADVKSFFKALVSGSTASGMGHRVYNSADRGSGQMGQQLRDQSGAQVESGRVYVSG